MIMKKIGFIDFFLSEWHANNYPAWIKEICAEKGLSYEVAYAYGEKPSVFDHMTTDEWCEKFSVTKCETIEELCEKSDCLLILAPSNPEKHLEYAKKVLPYKKLTYIDKTFAPNLSEAKEIFGLSEKYGTPIFSTSALRYGDEIKDVLAKSIITTGGGSNLPEYIIHQAEMVIKTLGVSPLRVKADCQDKKYIITAEFEEGKKATMIYANPLPFSVCITKEDGSEFYSEMKSPFFKGLISDILNFYETGKQSFCSCETLKVMALRDAALQASEKLNEWIECK
ncbi:MAG: hypothetical protein IKL74_01910 [Clostridia bacterium]|nr:hypothetical protein [Clostridia bacterium]